MRNNLIRSTAVAALAASLFAAPLAQAKGILRATISTSLNMDILSLCQIPFHRGKQ